MVFIDETGAKYRAVKKDGKYYLLGYCTDTSYRKCEKIEVKGKDNVLTYIKNNNLKKYDDTKDKEEEIRKELKRLSWWI